MGAFRLPIPLLPSAHALALNHLFLAIPAGLMAAVRPSVTLDRHHLAARANRCSPASVFAVPGFLPVVVGSGGWLRLGNGRRPRTGISAREAFDLAQAASPVALSPSASFPHAISRGRS